MSAAVSNGHYVCPTNLSMNLRLKALKWLFNYVQECFSSFVWSYSCLQNRRTLQKVAWVITTEGEKNNENPTYNQSIIIKSVYWAAADVRTSAAHVEAGNGRWKRACTLSLPFINKLAPENLCGQFPVEKRLGNFSSARLMPSWLQSHQSNRTISTAAACITSESKLSESFTVSAEVRSFHISPVGAHLKTLQSAVIQVQYKPWDIYEG